MAKYSDIKGFTVQTLSSDTIASQIAGGAWASGGSMPATRFEGFGAGTQTAALVSGGASTPPASANTVNTTIEYDGSSWTSSNNINTTRYDGGDFGTQTAAIDAGGDTPPSGAATDAVESYDGTNWTEIAEINTARNGQAGIGTTTAGLVAGGSIPASPYYGAVVESWNGSSWTEVNDLNDARNGSQGMGSSTAGLVCGGYNGTAYTGNTETWNGSSWTEVNNLNNGREGLGTSGTSTLGLAFGGYFDPSTRALTEAWDGTSWTEVADLSTARSQGTGSPAGTQALGLYSGGTVPAGQSIVEEWSAPSDFNQIQEGQLFFNSTTNTFKETISDVPGTSWSSGPAVNSTKSFNNGAGDLTSAITFGGAPSPTQAYSEQWNGSTWTEVSDLNEGRQAGSAGGASGTDAIMGGGYEGPNVSNSVNTEIWDGSSWTEVNNLNTQKYTAGSGIPVSTSGVAFGGNPYVANTEVWDGTNWTEVADLNTARMYLAGFGSATSAIAGNGIDPSASPPTYLQNKVEKWDGTSWTEVSEFNTARSEMLQGQGSSNASGIMSGGSTTGSNQIANTELWNGSSWTELNDLGTAKRMGAQIGSTSSGMYIAGQAPSPSTSVEHWESSLANKTITAS